MIICIVDTCVTHCPLTFQHQYHHHHHHHHHHIVAADMVSSHLKRAGLDYWQYVRLGVHEDWSAFCTSALGTSIPRSRWFYFSTKASTCLTTAKIWDPQVHRTHGIEAATSAVLVFGSETAGLYELLGAQTMAGVTAYRLPMTSTDNLASQPTTTPPPSGAIRSFNLSTSVGIGIWEAYRQIAHGIEHCANNCR
jgi:tRNA(Leu) C34 or U34 (ribose-2'-O)-methylase TrmL